MTTVMREFVSVAETGKNRDLSYFSATEGIASVMRQAKRARAAGDMARALTLYSRATDLDPNSAEAWAGRASTTSSLDDAIAAWAYAVALAPGNEARSMLSACVGEKLKKSVEDVRSLVTLGQELAQAGQSSTAYRLLKRATDLDESNEQAWVWRAGVSDDDAESVDCLKRALGLNPRNARAQAGLQWAEARLALASPSPKDAEQAALVLEQGQREFQRGERSRAYERFARATEIDPKNEMGWFWRASAAPDLDEALSCMDRLLAINPADEAARDARWWLRVQKLREHARAHVPNQTLHPTQSSDSRTFANERGGSAPFWIASAVVLFLIAVFAVLIAMLLTGRLT